MRKVNKNQRNMVRSTLLILILFSVFAGSCSSRKNKLDRSGLIPEKELVSILSELYITDGLMTLPKVHYWFPAVDSTTSYFHVIEKHGYTKETMDKTMKYYYMKKPKELIKIYDKALGILSEMDSRFEKEAVIFQAHVSNMWPVKELIYLPDQKGKNSAAFNIPLNTPGVYTLSYSATIYPDDEALNPHLTAFTCHPDSTGTGKRKYYETLDYIKDGALHFYSLTIIVPPNIKQCLKGWMLDYCSNTGENDTHATFENITLFYSGGLP